MTISRSISLWNITLHYLMIELSLTAYFGLDPIQLHAAGTVAERAGDPGTVLTAGPLIRPRSRTGELLDGL